MLNIQDHSRNVTSKNACHSPVMQNETSFYSILKKCSNVLNSCNCKSFNFIFSEGVLKKN